VRRALAPALALGFVLASRPARAADGDDWLGADKVQHFAASAGIAAGGYALGAALWDDRARPLVLGAGLGIAAGVGKEALDLVGPGTASWRDLAWDGMGVVLGVALAWSVDVLVRGVSERRPSLASSPLRFTF
jgi:uncharacterized protein YfiM (DUF2279 family)